MKEAISLGMKTHLQERISQTQPSSPLAGLRMSHDQVVFENVYCAILELKKESVINDAQKKQMKERLISQEPELISLIH